MTKILGWFGLVCALSRFREEKIKMVPNAKSTKYDREKYFIDLFILIEKYIYDGKEGGNFSLIRREG